MYVDSRHHVLHKKYTVITLQFPFNPYMFQSPFWDSYIIASLLSYQAQPLLAKRVINKNTLKK